MNSKDSPRSPNDIDRHVGIRVRLRRRVIGLSQQALADSLGVTFQQVQKYENGVNRIGAGRLYQLSQALQVPVSYFYEDFDPETGTGAEDDGEDAVVTFIRSRDGVQLAQALNRIGDPKVRRHLLQLANTLAADTDDEA